MPKTTNNTEISETSFDIITGQDWNVKEHSCGTAKNNKSGQGKSTALLYHNKKFYLKIPKMPCTFGASRPKPNPKEAPKENEPWSIQLVFGDDVQNRAFLDNAKKFDQFMIDEGCKPENNVQWGLGTKSKLASREVVESKYKSMVKLSKDKATGEVSEQYPPFIRVAFTTTFNPPYEFTSEFYDKDNELMVVSPDPNADNSIKRLVPSGCQCSALLAGSIWSNTTGFGVTWKVVQIKIFPSRNSIPKGKCQIDDPSDDIEEEDIKEDKKDKKEKEKEKEKEVEEEEIEDEDEVIEEVKDDIIISPTETKQEPKVEPKVEVKVEPKVEVKNVGKSKIFSKK